MGERFHYGTRGGEVSILSARQLLKIEPTRVELDSFAMSSIMVYTTSDGDYAAYCKALCQWTQSGCAAAG